MADIEKVIKGLEAHEKGCGYRSHYCDVMECSYRYGDESCDIEEMCHDALTLLKEREAEIDAISDEYLDLGNEIAKMPKVVRCKDCKHFEKADNDAFLYLHCNNLHNEVPNEDWFCADGERKG